MDSLPTYYLNRPAAEPPDERDFKRLLDAMRAGDVDLSYDAEAPVWQFLCWLADTQDVLLHGTSAPDITEFEPRLPADDSEFGNQQAVFAASDGLWAMYFAILDRAVAWSLVNMCATVTSDDDEATVYYFSVNDDALPDRAWSPGFIYVLPRAGFVREPAYDENGATAHMHQWANPSPVTPIGRIAVNPADFPFLKDVKGHDYETVKARATADPDAFPWSD